MALSLYDPTPPPRTPSTLQWKKREKNDFFKWINAHQPNTRRIWHAEFHTHTHTNLINIWYWISFEPYRNVKSEHFISKKKKNTAAAHWIMHNCNYVLFASIACRFCTNHPNRPHLHPAVNAFRQKRKTQTSSTLIIAMFLPLVNSIHCSPLHSWSTFSFSDVKKWCSGS